MTPEELQGLLRQMAVLEEQDTFAMLGIQEVEAEATYTELADMVQRAGSALDKAKLLLDEFIQESAPHQARQNIQGKLAVLKDTYKNNLKAYALAHDSKKPFQGSGLAVVPDGEVRLTDESAALAWFQANMPVCLKVDMGMVKKFAPALKGFHLPWLEVKDSYRVTVPALDAWKNESEG